MKKLLSTILLTLAATTAHAGLMCTGPESNAVTPNLGCERLSAAPFGKSEWELYSFKNILAYDTVLLNRPNDIYQQIMAVLSPWRHGVTAVNYDLAFLLDQDITRLNITSPYFSERGVCLSPCQRNRVIANNIKWYGSSSGQTRRVPEPGPVWLLGLGLVGLVAVRRKGAGNG